MTTNTLKSIQDKAKATFEANMLDGDKVEDCGGAMLSEESVWALLKEQISLAYKQGQEEEREKNINHSYLGMRISGRIIQLKKINRLIIEKIVGEEMENILRSLSK